MGAEKPRAPPNGWRPAAHFPRKTAHFSRETTRTDAYLNLAQVLDLLDGLKVGLHALNGHQLAILDARRLEHLGEGPLALLADDLVLCGTPHTMRSTRFGAKVARNSCARRRERGRGRARGEIGSLLFGHRGGFCARGARPFRGKIAHRPACDGGLGRDRDRDRDFGRGEAQSRGARF